MQRPNFSTSLAWIRARLLVILVGVAAIAVATGAGVFVYDHVTGGHSHNDSFVARNGFEVPGRGTPANPGPNRAGPGRTGQNRTGFLGVSVQVQNNAVVVTNVASGSPADQAGIKSGDTIVQVNGKNVTDVQTLRTAIAGAQPGSSYKVQVRRNGQDQTLTVPASPTRTPRSTTVSFELQ